MPTQPAQGNQEMAHFKAGTVFYLLVAKTSTKHITHPTCFTGGDQTSQLSKLGSLFLSWPYLKILQKL